MSSNRTDLPSDTAANFSQRVRETLMTYLGRQGDPLDQGLTIRDLLDSGIIALKSGFNVNNIKGSLTLPITGGSEVGTNDVEDLTPPPAPTGFIATPAIVSILFETAAPTYLVGNGHLKTVIYGATWVSGPLPTFSSAVKITEFGGTVHGYPTNPATTWHLWAKWMTNDGVLSASPAGGTNGVVATTGQDVAKLLEALTNQLTESQLYNALGTRINLIDGASGVAGSVNARVLAEALLRAAADTVIEQSTSTLSAQVNHADTGLPKSHARITSEATVAANATSAVANNLTVLSAQVNHATTGLPTALAKVIDVETAQIGYCTIGGIATDHRIKTTCIAAGGTWNVGLPFASAVKQVHISDGVSTGTIEQRATAYKTNLGTLDLQHTVKIDNNGYVTGYGLASTTSNGVPTSEFIIRADNFAIAPVNTDHTALDGSPFFCRTSSTVINGETIPPGVYMKAAFIHDATITTAKITNLAVTNGKITDLTADKITAGTLQAGVSIESTGYSASYGFKLDAVTGKVFARDAEITGKITATSGLIGGNTIDSSSIRTQAGYNSGAGFYLGSNGTFSVGNSAGNRLTWNGSSLNINGEINVGGFTGYQWPPAGQTGAHLSAQGLAVGNANDNKYFVVTAGGDIYTPKFTMINGVMTIDQVDVIKTLNIAGNAASVIKGSTISNFTTAFVSITITSADLPTGFSTVPIVITASGDTAGEGVQPTNYSFNIARNPSDLTLTGNMLYATPPAGVVSMTIVDPQGVGTYNYYVYNHLQPNVNNGVQRFLSITAQLGKR